MLVPSLAVSEASQYWLPDDEADQLRFEFAQEIERLSKAA
jgi:hypothetical protein